MSETAVKNGARANIHLAVDTGMSRIGMTPNEAASADEAARIYRLPEYALRVCFTHFCQEADEADKAFYEAQYKKYREFCEMLCSRGVDIPIRHCSNSAGIVEGWTPTDWIWCAPESLFTACTHQTRWPGTG